MSSPIGITVLGSTGSIGRSTLDVLKRHTERFQVIALSAYSNVEELYQQCLEWQPAYAVMVDEKCAQNLAIRLNKKMPDSITVLSGAKALETVASLDETDYLMAAIVGAAGLASTLAAAQCGKRILLANKEALVMSGNLLIQAVTNGKAELLPVDSEHNAIFQCLPSSAQQRNLENPIPGLEKILLTASGGPFLDTPLENLSDVTPDMACKHPNWVMGRKISVDSATMMNKGLEVIEASWLFSLVAKNIEVVIHRQSIIHSMVSWSDGSVLAQLGNPDMRTPIAHALAWPERIASGVEALDIFAVGQLDFRKADFSRFPCLRLAYEALNTGGTAPSILNAANEIAVEAFLQQQVRFTDIALIIESVLTELSVQNVDSLNTVISADEQARRIAREKIVAI